MLYCQFHFYKVFYSYLLWLILRKSSEILVNLGFVGCGFEASSVLEEFS